ncbi:MAG: prolyl oligopeptidase family serine peptidase [Planctomycetota bacterium]
MPRLLLVPLFLIVATGAASAQAPSTGSDSKPWTADPQLVNSKQKKTNTFNYIEANVPAEPLPNVLQTVKGASIADAASWNSHRPALLQLFRDHVYGNRPNPNRYKVEFQLREEIAAVLDGRASARRVRVAITSDAGKQHQFDISLAIPIAADAQHPVPAIVHINNRGLPPTLRESIENSDPFTSVAEIIKRGCAWVSFHTSDVDPDTKGRRADGIRGCIDPGKPSPTDWAALSAWGWAASRCVDYLETLDMIDSDACAVVGHSRGGKTALWAAAEDKRFAVAYSNNSGCGGAALSRRKYGETIRRITETFPYWFCQALNQYRDKEERLPVDQHQLIALIAPRSVYVASADQDLWADPRGEYLSLIMAAPAFGILGSESIRDPEMPALDQQRISVATGYHIRGGGHNLTAVDWKLFLDFAVPRLKQK